MRYNVDDIIIFKKNHACGANKWKVIQTGANIKLECQQCGRYIDLLPIEVDKRKKNL